MTYALLACLVVDISDSRVLTRMVRLGTIALQSGKMRNSATPIPSLSLICWSDLLVGDQNRHPLDWREVFA